MKKSKKKVLRFLWVRTMTIIVRSQQEAFIVRLSHYSNSNSVWVSEQRETSQFVSRFMHVIRFVPTQTFTHSPRSVISLSDRLVAVRCKAFHPIMLIDFLHNYLMVVPRDISAFLLDPNLQLQIDEEIMQILMNARRSFWRSVVGDAM